MSGPASIETTSSLRQSETVDREHDRVICPSCNGNYTRAYNASG
jgi:hypothetical protein